MIGTASARQKSALARALSELTRRVLRRTRRLMSDRAFVIGQYTRLNGVPPNLETPRDLSEKMCWLKLNHLTPLHIQCCDKLAVRDYVAETVGADILIPLLLETDNAADIGPETINAGAFVLKTNHDSGGVVICRDRQTFDWDKARAFLAHRMRQNHYWTTREIAYKPIKPRILVEEMLPSTSDKPLLDYKIWCFGGRVEVIQLAFIHQSFGADGHKTAEGMQHAFYSAAWEKLNMQRASPIYPDDVPRPEGLERLIEIAERLSTPFPYCRVDLYLSENKVYFGEMTFYPSGGHVKCNPPEMERHLGDMLALPAPVDVRGVLRDQAKGNR